MHKFNITDIVSLKENESTLFMVVDVMDFTKATETGKNKVVDIDYELMQIYPIRKNSSYTVVSQGDLMIREKEGSRNYKMLLEFIEKDREKQGWFGMPDFLQIARRNKISDERMKAVSADNFKPTGMPEKKQDAIRYDLLKTIDDCLDAINDLNRMYKMFGDESYLQLKEVVTARIITLQKK